VDVLTLQAAGAHYGLELSAVRAVIARPPLRPLVEAPPWAAGVFRLRGRLVPVVDLGVLHGGAPARPAYASRVVIVTARAPDGRERPLGLLAEQVTDIVPIDERSLDASGLATPAASWLGRLAPAPQGHLIQLVDVAGLLTDEVRARLVFDEEPSRD
jgi:chemotaxis-related protein WspB